MQDSSQVGILKIYISSSDRINHTNLYEFLVLEARKEGLAGATALKGILGYGASSVIHSYKLWEVVDKVPVVVELVDDYEKIQRFYKMIAPVLESMKYGCLVTLETTNVLLNKPGKKRFLDAD